ncbi:MAG TPA: DMT family transporter [Prolixibacteraceae bacterium]|nr:DMT family transporter [Prolixibacteraceae bacterium]
MEQRMLAADRKKSFLFAGVAVLIWSTVATAFKLGLRELHYAQLIFIASGVSLLIFTVYLVFTGQLQQVFRSTFREWLWSATLGFLNPFAYYLIIFKSYSLLPAQIAQPLNMIWPLVLALLSVPLLKQSISWKQFASLGVCFLGIVILSSQGSLSGYRNTSFPGVLLAVGSSFFWALYWILNVKDHRPEAIKLFQSFLFGFIYLLATLPFFSGFSFSWGISLWAALYIGFFEVGITYLIWMRAMHLSDNNALTGSLIYIAPFISLILISTVIGETIHFTTFLGLTLIASAILYVQLSSKRKVTNDQ